MRIYGIARHLPVRRRRLSGLGGAACRFGHLVKPNSQLNRSTGSSVIAFIRTILIFFRESLVFFISIGIMLYVSRQIFKFYVNIVLFLNEFSRAGIRSAELFSPISF